MFKLKNSVFEFKKVNMFEFKKVNQLRRSFFLRAFKLSSDSNRKLFSTNKFSICGKEI